MVACGRPVADHRKHTDTQLPTSSAPRCKDWAIRNRVLEERLAGCDRWRELDARLTDVRTVLGGLGNIDRFSAERDGKPFEAISLRLWNPAAEEWTIWWADSRTVRLEKQVRGRFESGTGNFFGERLLRGRTVKVRFRWSEIEERSARWEQAYLEATGEWETNWIMEFRATND